MNPIYQLFEGECPTCGAFVEVMRVDGTEKALAEWGNEANGTVWDAEAPERLGVDLGVTWVCDNGHEHYAERYAVSGDWAS